MFGGGDCGVGASVVPRWVDSMGFGVGLTIADIFWSSNIKSNDILIVTTDLDRGRRLTLPGLF